MQTKAKKRIVILGAGFGGIHTFLNLKAMCSKDDVDVVLVNRTNYFLFTPMLHEVATGGLNQEHVVESVRDIIKDFSADFYQTEILEVVTQENKVKTTWGNIEYDYLVIATGATTNFYNTPGAENCMVLKDLKDAANLRNYFIDTFENASKTPDATTRKKMLSFTLVGGGATGVELAAEMADLFYETMKDYYKHTLNVDEATINLVSATPNLLMQFDQALRDKSNEALVKNKVNVLLNKAVKEVVNDGVIFSDGQKLESGLVIWVAGVKPNTPKFDISVELDKSQRIVCESTLKVKGLNNIFALGDVACVLDQNQNPLPMLAQVAVSQAQTLAFNLKSTIEQSLGASLNPSLKNFEYKSKGSLVSLGRWDALGDMFGLKLSGPHIWWLWRTVYLSKMASLKKKIKVAVDWTANLFYPRDITKC